MTLNPCLLLNRVDDISYGAVEVPKISDPHDVLVEVKKTGICRSDIHYYTHGGIGRFKLVNPMVLGHESSGVVTSVGTNVTSLRPGDRVAIEPGMPSRYSEEYKSGHYNLCPHMEFAATPNPDPNGKNPMGTLCRYFKSAEDFLVKLPEYVSLELGALVEPMAGGVHALQLSSIRFGDNVVVFGAGPVGLLAASVAKKFGAQRVMLVDISDDKLRLAKDIGAVTHTFNSKNGGPSDLIAAFDSVLPDKSLECSGAPQCINMSLEVLKPGGYHVQVGSSPETFNISFNHLNTKEITIFGSFRYAYNDYKTAVKILDNNYKNGKDKAEIDFERLITHRFKFDDAVLAYNLVRDSDKCVKCIIDGPV